MHQLSSSGPLSSLLLGLLAGTTRWLLKCLGKGSLLKQAVNSLAVSAWTPPLDAETSSSRV